ncbi:hypothetical protein Aph01nite_50170 [Acrocarpospora phusangensis]|uniref:Aminoglycoside phosphotransferase domain-containing protein n=1 Tax=Acrocarpospora phusangensis TaxID=1070424 RepID=A0A919QD20_9ACTN|nr:phosphotransferase [Acrocarpospora phusangensis]GIH26707.1 hypothetical protein Aph01nite_50170 [Acrocarpospora phusangensis]
MFTPPEDLPATTLAAEIGRGWGVEAGSLVYRPVGFGSHHWEVRGDGDGRWFATVDDLEQKRRSRDEPLDEPFGRLASALAAARALHDQGHHFAAAPLPARDGRPLIRLTPRYGLALYPYIDGESFAWGEFPTPEHRRAVLGLLVSLHGAPVQARADDFALLHRDQLEASLLSPDAEDVGPYARPAARLMTANAARVTGMLARYDELARRARTRPAVLTHGEPHPGNTMRTADGFVLIDWETALLAPPERDLWALDPGDGSILTAYATATGVTPDPAVMELYQIRWTLTDLAICVAGFRAPHTGTRDDAESWRILLGYLDQPW